MVSCFGETIPIGDIVSATKLRVYCDVDGVIYPYYSEENVACLDFEFPLTIDDGGTEIHGVFRCNSEIAGFLSRLSRHPEVEFVWLTAWKEKAQQYLDEPLNIDSKRWLDWKRRLSDYTHYGKIDAIIQDQKEAPCDFIWLEDLANAPLGSPLSECHVFSHPRYVHEEGDDWVSCLSRDSYLSINTDLRVGLTLEHVSMIEQWCAQRSVIID